MSNVVELAALFALALQGSSSRVADVNDWSIYDNRGTCAAITSYESNTSVWLSYDPSRNLATLTLTNPAWETVQEGADYRVEIAFSNGSEYGPLTANGMRTDSEDLRLTGVMMRLVADEFLHDFAEATGMLVRMGQRRLANLSLTGSRQMVERLIRCSNDSQRRYPPDPFEGVRPLSSPSTTGSATSEPARLQGSP